MTIVTEHWWCNG